MKKLLIIAAVILIAGGAYFALTSKDAEIRVLVFSKTEQFRHESIGAGKIALMELGKARGFTVDTTENADRFTEKSLKNYNVIVFLNTTGDVLNDAQQIEMNRFVQAGGGFVGIHAAADTEYDWPWYGELVGGYFESHPNDPNVREGVVQLVDTEHISTKMLPATWKRNDEWYDYNAMQPNLNILLNVDESAYKQPDENPAAEPRPIAWYREFDGGRMFYTGLGHTDESFSEALFLDHLHGGIVYAAGDGVLDYNNANVAPEENRFTKVVLDFNLHEPMELDLLDDGRIIFIERPGNVKIYDFDIEETKTIATLDVFYELEDGLLGVAVDPDYATNNWIYLFYSPAGDEAKQLVSRFDLVGENLDLASEKILLEIPVQREECCHSAGALEFGPGGHLYISTGDNTNPHESDGFNPVDERDGRGPWDAQKSSSNTNDLRGKILRIKPETDGSYSIPDGNLFAKDGSEGRPEIYVMGCRNPFRIAIDQRTGDLYWGDVGPDAGSDSSARGPAGHDEVNRATAPGFFGWPYFIGDNKAYVPYDFATKTSGEKPFDPAAPMNNSPNNTGATQLPPAQPAYIWYPYGKSTEFPMVGDGGRNAMAGPVFYYEDYPESGIKFPEYYDGKLFIYEWMRRWIMAVTMNEDGSINRIEPFLPNLEMSNPMDIRFGPKDGAIYMLEYGTNWFSQNLDARLVRIEYTSGNRKPVARIIADKTIGAVPLTVQFSAENSIDFDGDELRYSWTFEGATIEASSETSPLVNFGKPGRFKATLEVQDPDGLTATATTELLVGNEPPTVSWEIDGNSSFFWPGVPFQYEFTAADAEDATIDPQKIIVSIDYLPEGVDITSIAQGHQAMAEASRMVIGEQLIAQSDCFSCHQVSTTSVGPTYQEIAERYNGNIKEIDKLPQKIIEGGNGVWGPVFMPAHPDLPEEAAQQMVKYIMSFSDDKSLIASTPPKGRFTPSEEGGKALKGGAYILTASYTDNGGSEIGPLTAQEIITLKHPRVEAETNDEAHSKVLNLKVPDEWAQYEGHTIVMGQKNGYIAFKETDLSNITAITMRIAYMPNVMLGGQVELRLGGIDGELIGAAEVKTGVTNIGQQTPKVEIKPQNGRQDLFLVFRSDSEEEGMVTVVDWLYFHHKNGIEPIL